MKTENIILLHTVTNSAGYPMDFDAENIQFNLKIINTITVIILCCRCFLFLYISNDSAFFGFSKSSNWIEWVKRTILSEIFVVFNRSGVAFRSKPNRNENVFFPVHNLLFVIKNVAIETNQSHWDACIQHSAIEPIFYGFLFFSSQFDTKRCYMFTVQHFNSLI